MSRNSIRNGKRACPPDTCTPEAKRRYFSETSQGNGYRPEIVLDLPPELQLLISEHVIRDESLAREAHHNYDNTKRLDEQIQGRATTEPFYPERHSMSDLGIAHKAIDKAAIADIDSDRTISVPRKNIWATINMLTLRKLDRQRKPANSIHTFTTKKVEFNMANCTTSAPATAPAKNRIPLLTDFPSEIRQQILLDVLTDQDISNTIELKARKVPDYPGSYFCRYMATWAIIPLPPDRATNPRVMRDSIRPATGISDASSKELLDFACRWNVPAPLFALDYAYIDAKWSERQTELGQEKVAAFSSLFGDKFCINCVKHYMSFPDDASPSQNQVVQITTEVCPIGTGVAMPGGMLQMPGGMFRMPGGTLQMIPGLGEKCPPGIMETDRAQLRMGFIKIEVEEA
ncbi:hypothetical protein FKW77_010496 [Venturia effusa]|uniref:Uncharacterized protein n=1 Tax=Venturia effusa TaxID=50376 RepID=A0A517L2E7_9PEZI|nr:hypothetical protein FKW77_010496 [Venturia effusa]